MQWCALLALTALVTNDQLRLAPTDGAPLMLAIASAAGHHLELRYAPSRASELRTSDCLPHRCAPSRASELPTPVTFNSAYFLLVALLRQRSRLMHRAVPLLIATIRGLLLTAAYSSLGPRCSTWAWAIKGERRDHPSPRPT